MKTRFSTLIFILFISLISNSQVKFTNVNQEISMINFQQNKNIDSLKEHLALNNTILETLSNMKYL